MAKLSIHHATARKAEREGVRLTIEDDTIVAIDTLHAPDHEFSGPDAARLLATVLERRSALTEIAAPKPTSKPAPPAARPTPKSEADDPPAGDPAVRAGTVVAPKYKLDYELHDGTCGDAFADAFSVTCRDARGALDLDRLYEVGRDNGVDVEARWGALNPGQRRMNLSNVLRGKLRRGEEVRIGRTTLRPIMGDDGKPVRGKYDVATSRGVRV